MLQVLHVTQPVDGGVGRYVAATAAAQDAAGLRVALASPPGQAADAVRDSGIDWLRWEASRAPGPSVAGEVVRLRQLIRSVNPDVVHLHSSKAGLAGRLAMRGRRPTIFQPHGWAWQTSDGPIARASEIWEKRAARWTTALLCVSTAELRAGIAHGVRLAAADGGVGPGAHVITNGVDLERFRPFDPGQRAGARERLGLPAEARVVVCVGRLNEQKGQETLVRAWPAVAAAVPLARLALVGDGVHRQRLVTLAEALAVSDSLLFAGEVADVRPWYAAADVAAFSSRWGEAMALTPLEAMASGLPVVASDVAGIRESLGPGCGQIVPPGDADAVSVELIRRLADRDLCRREGAAARHHAERFLDVRRGHDRLRTLTCSLAPPRPPP